MSILIRTLIVDDSAFARKMVRAMLSRSPFIEVVGVARDGNEALEMVERLKPDVVTCDLMMPVCDGVSFVRQQMERRPLPIVLLTSTAEDGPTVIEALEAGAVDIVRKPSALATSRILDINSELIEKVKAASRVSMNPIRKPRTPIEAENSFKPRVIKSDIVVIGLSTGGPQAIRAILAALPADFPVPIAVIVHMPVGYTHLMAEKLNELSQLTVCEAKEGEPFLPGKAILARAGRHLGFQRTSDGTVVAQLTVQPLDTPHRPSIDVLFKSASETYGERVLAVVMTGMGNDGTRGAAWIKSKGGTVLTETEESCVVYGMPRSVVEASLSDHSASLSDMPKAILNHL